MSTAVIYSGQARSFSKVVWNHHWHLLRKLTDPVIYVSVADDAQADDMRQLEQFGWPVYFEKVQQPELTIPDVRPGMLGCYPTSSPPQAILRQFWALDRAWTFAIENGAGKCETVVRVRPDLAFARVHPPSWISRRDCYTPWWSRWGGINDRFAIMGQDAASLYFRTQGIIPWLVLQGCPLHPETMLAASLETMKLSTNLTAEFITLRMDGTVVPMDPTAIDLADRRSSC